MDLELLSLISNRDKYTRFAPYIEENILGSKEARIIYNAVGDYYKNNKLITSIDWNAFKTWMFQWRAHMLGANLESYHIIFDKLLKHKPTATDEDVLQSYIIKDYTTRIVQQARKVQDGGEKLDTLIDLVAECKKEVDRAIDPATAFVSSDTTDILAATTGPGFEWKLGELELSMGPLRKGDFIILAARPETGKTTFIADQIGYMATQIKDTRPMIWVNNEERSEKVMLRVKQAALGITTADFRSDPVKWNAEYVKRMNGDPDRIRIITNDSGNNDVRRLTDLFRQFNPAIIVFDQLDKVHGFNNEDREDQRLTKLYNWARELAHQYGPVIAVSQLDGTAENERYPGMNQLANSKTGKPGEADAIITIGKTNDVGFKDVRFINVPKNKLTGGSRTNPAHRHAAWEVKILPEIAQYEGTH